MEREGAGAREAILIVDARLNTAERAGSSSETDMGHITCDRAKMARLVETKVTAGLLNASIQGERDAKALLSQPGSGQQYGDHKSSAPGQPPAPDTGHMRTATQATLEVVRGGEDLVTHVVTNVPQAVAMEKGTERMAARPYLSRLGSDHGPDLAHAFIEGAKRE